MGFLDKYGLGRQSASSIKFTGLDYDDNDDLSLSNTNTLSTAILNMRKTGDITPQTGQDQLTLLNWLKDNTDYDVIPEFYSQIVGQETGRYATYDQGKKQFYSKYSELGKNITTMLEGAPKDDNDLFYLKNSKEMKSVKNHLAEFYRDYGSFYDEHASLIGKDVGFLHNSGQLMNFYGETLTAILNNGGLDTKEGEVIATGNYRGFKIINDQNAKRISILENNLKYENEKLITMLASNHYNKDAPEVKTAKGIIENVAKELQTLTNVNYLTTDAAIEGFGLDTDKEDVTGTFDLHDIPSKEGWVKLSDVLNKYKGTDYMPDLKNQKVRVGDYAYEGRRLFNIGKDKLGRVSARVARHNKLGWPTDIEIFNVNDILIKPEVVKKEVKERQYYSALPFLRKYNKGISEGSKNYIVIQPKVLKEGELTSTKIRVRKVTTDYKGLIYEAMDGTTFKSEDVKVVRQPNIIYDKNILDFQTVLPRRT